MTETNHERCNEDVAAYMLGALEPGEAAALEHHAASCERCQAEIRWLTPALDALPEGIERLQPPPELRSRLLAEVRADAGGGAATGSAVRGDSRAATPGLLDRASAWMRDLGSGPMGLRPVAGVAVAVLVVAGVAGFAIGGGIGSDTVSGETSTVVINEPSGVSAKMIREGDRGTLRLAKVRKLPSERVLEAWVQRDGEVKPVPALFVPDREGQASTELPNMNGVEVVMVTTEPAGGSRSPTSVPIVTIPIQ
jgi:anti-sigma-K factor RskA